MKKSLLFIFVVTFLFCQSTLAQEMSLRHGFASSAVGLSRLMPSFKKEVDAPLWKGFHVRRGILELQYFFGDFSYKQLGDADYVQDKGTLMNVGFNFPFHKLTLLQRKNYLTGIHITPLLGTHYSFQTMGRINRSYQGAHGINVAPGLSVQFPFVVLDLKLNSGFYFGDNSQLEKYRKALMFSPSVSLQLDGLYELLGGRAFKTGDYEYNFTYLADRDKKYIGNDEIEITETYVTERRSGEAYVSIQNAFWYVSGKFHLGSKTLAEYGQPENYDPGIGLGAGIGGRWRVFMGDISFEKNQGFYAIRNSKYISALSEARDVYPLVEGRFNATEIRGKAGVDLLNLVANVIMPKRNQRLRNLTGNWVKFTRLHGGVSGGFSFPGKTTVLTDNGAAALDKFFITHPEIERNQDTDIMENGVAWTIGLFVNWEMGPISLEFDWHGHQNFGYRSSAGITYLLPIAQLVKSLKG